MGGTRTLGEDLCSFDVLYGHLPAWRKLKALWSNSGVMLFQLVVSSYSFIWKARMNMAEEADLLYHAPHFPLLCKTATMCTVVSDDAGLLTDSLE